MALSFLVYWGLACYLTINAVIVKKVKSPMLKKFYLVNSLLIISVILGFRYDVGVDYLTYMSSYEDYYIFETPTNFEFGFDYLIKLCAFLGFDYYMFFAATVFLEWLFWYLAFKDNKELLPYALLFLFITSSVFDSLNIVRQSIAIAISIYSYKFIIQKSIYKYLLFVFLAFSFHFSSIILIPLYILVRNYNNTYFFDKIHVQITLYLLSWLLGPAILSKLISSFLNIFEGLGYLSYSLFLEDMTIEIGSGIGIIFNHLVNILLLWACSYLTKKLHYNELKVYVRLFFIGSVLANLLGFNMVLSRIPLALCQVKIILLAIVFYKIRVFSGLKNIAYVILIAYCILFTKSILTSESQCSPYQFVSFT